MLDFILYGVFALDIVNWVKPTNQHVLELARTPFAINLGIFGALLVPFLVQSQVRSGLIYLSIASLFIMTGLVFTGSVLIACAIVFCLARLLQKWAIRRGSTKLPHITAWIVVNAMYVPWFYVTYPSFDGFMSIGELVLFWGLCFLVFRAIHYLHMSCKQKVDPFAQDAFPRFLLYMIHFPSFWFGPYQKFSQFDEEVDTCKTRINRENRISGAKRIGIGIAKFMVIFHGINVPFFYKLNFYGPFSDDFFANATQLDRGEAWMFSLLFMLRIALFISAVSDGAIGMNRMMGIRVAENSNWPLLARDTQIFWQRWHIQAGLFFREEVFFPAGGMRNRVRGFTAVFLYCGFWHFPSFSSIILFPALNLAMMELSVGWKNFWKRHRRQDDWIHHAGIKYRLHGTWFSGAIGIALTVNLITFSALLIHDHYFTGGVLIPYLFGF